MNTMNKLDNHLPSINLVDAWHQLDILGLKKAYYKNSDDALALESSVLFL